MEAVRRNGYGTLLTDQFERTGDPSVLHAAVRELRLSAHNAVDAEQSAAVSNNLAIALGYLAAFADGGNDVLIEAVAAARCAVRCGTGDAEYLPGRLSVLGAALRALGDRTADLDLIREARQIGERGVALTPVDHPSRGMHIANLAQTLVSEHLHSGDVALLREVFSRCQEALPSLPPGSRHYASARMVLVSALHHLAEATGAVEPLQEAEHLLGAVLQHVHGSIRTQALVTITHTTHQLYARTGDPTCLARTVERGRELIDCTAASDPQLLARLRNLGSDCSVLFARDNDEAWLDEGIAALRRAHRMPGPDDPERRGSLVPSRLLRWKAEENGDASLLEEADQVCQRAVLEGGNDSAHLAEHMNVRLRLHRTTGRLEVLRSGIEIGVEAMSRTALDDTEREQLGNTTIDGLRSLYELTGEQDALDRGIALAETELSRDPAPDSTWRVMLASMRAMRPADLDAAETLLRGFLAAITADHRGRRAATSVLADVLSRRYQHTGALAFLRGGDDPSAGERHGRAGRQLRDLQLARQFAGRAVWPHT
ncbi:hypothetical protein [Dactylosporangium sp. NPDC051541]|uniref:hypothetical protein n=1 Tax=Dactylosporangium sp. NPDC051541 TaxID=3363977 RepID=UPI00378A06F8